MENIRPYKRFFSTSEIWLADIKRSFTREDFENMAGEYYRETNDFRNLSFNEVDLRILLDYFSRRGVR